MADQSLALNNTLRHLSGENLLPEPTGFMLNRIMDADVTQRIEAEPHERSDWRETCRNGYHDRQYNTWLDTPDLRIPKLREGSSHLSSRPADCAETVLNAAIQGAWINGVSTCKVDALYSRWG